MQLFRMLACAVTVTIVVGVASRADAQTDITRAKTLYEQAQAAESAQRYDDAARLYLEAYRYYADPEFYFNAGEVYRLAGDTAQAVQYFEKYLSLDPKGRGADYAREAIAALKPALTTEPGSEPPGNDTLAPDLSSSGSGRTAATAVPHAVDVPPRDEPEQPGRGLRIAGLVTIGVSVAWLGVGIYAGLEAKSISDELSDVVQWRPELDDRYEQGENYETLMFVCSAVSVVSAVTGGVLYLAGSRSARSQSTLSIAPTATGSSAGVTLGGTF